MIEHQTEKTQLFSYFEFMDILFAVRNLKELKEHFDILLMLHSAQLQQGRHQSKKREGLTTPASRH